MMNKFVVVILFLSQFTNCKTSGKINIASLDHIPAIFLGNFKDDYGIRYTIDRQTWYSTQTSGITCSNMIVMDNILSPRMIRAIPENPAYIPG